ncbi:hypothetical protein LMB56_10320 [Limosilactobacillus reuteri]|uniref:sunset domain-containing protein n=1 Tax=Limosilactobacillus reuteri TaxID=1598 RepID=UPI001E612929|nr:hypothetical protein [Limosilactobacillus reuteri]MCC4436817.1 hypothetical protein [Limosilactobacillus reuteri]MCC4436932.1 hypothetical protein [Limosilactobacillus reuteri]MCC4441564.1 hypothetical protein [Limosilactobacillus reuteri]MCC4443570.1 hypothetical protein [Limosilactobacillus reuteri]MCC4446614.1 hypothetical protein [Limosilactobacillus reuteri]
MKNKGLGTIIGFAFVLFIIIWLFKILMFLGIIASIVAIIYFGVKVYQENDNRKHLFLTRILPSLIALIIFSSLYGAANNTTKEISHSASSAKVSSSSSKKDEGSSNKDESADDESNINSSDDYDDSSTENNDDSDTSNEASSTATSNDSNDTDFNTVKGDMETDQQGTIVGNSRTMVYHTPDQQGYRMNSANAVYFNTEAEAQAAGYRKSAR